MKIFFIANHISCKLLLSVWIVLAWTCLNRDAVGQTCPQAFYIGGGGLYCPGSSPSPITLSSSVNGAYYRLYREGNPNILDSWNGTGYGHAFALQTTTGSYYVTATYN